MNNAKEQLNRKVQSLIQIQMQILKYLDPNEMKNDPAINAFFNTDNPNEIPQSALIYSPLVTLLDREISKEIQEVKSMQNTLSQLVAQESIQKQKSIFLLY